MRRLLTNLKPAKGFNSIFMYIFQKLLRLAYGFLYIVTRRGKKIAKEELAAFVRQGFKKIKAAGVKLSELFFLNNSI